ncbi:glycosyltransferase family 31 protein [Thelephora terrestris]|uniref:Glycosyltransferase family 31 protein n=1 Tax=Thelephora terrestris TaxID=56493 RepID=A0A9P6L7X0_9AGAM|nr:glycosyltransferase family 31 protein [Thelephora terrestris]
MCSTAANSPINSRAGSPSPFFYSSAASASSSEEDESDSPSPYLNSAGGTVGTWWREDSSSTPRRRWPWLVNGGGGNATHSRRRRRMNGYGFKLFKRLVRKMLCIRPFIPKQPIMILLTLLVLIAFGTSLTLLLMHILNPDKEPLPWRYYCSVPSTSTAPPSLYPSTSYLSHIKTLRNAATNPPPDFPPPDFDSIPPVGVFVGVFSLDSSFERRQLIRSTWAGHERSRDGAGEGDGGLGTSRTIVRFILGQPSKEWERRVMLEMDTFNDIVIVPMHENMNTGKSHAYFTWASSYASVPPPVTASSSRQPSSANNPFVFSYSNTTFPPPLLADHDPIQMRQERVSSLVRPWVRPDFVVKADDDAFVMLAELESRLRVRLHDEVKPDPSDDPSQTDGDGNDDHLTPEPSSKQGKGPSSSSSSSGSATSVRTPAEDTIVDHPASTASFPPFREASLPKRVEDDPLIYWGYLVKNRFMAGELYALSWALVDWVAKDSAVKTKIKGAEDKQTAKWVMMHPKAHQVRWASERCWIYDHPRAGTVYSHGFLFPSEVKRVKKFLFSYLDSAPKKRLDRSPSDPERQGYLNGADGDVDGQDQVPAGTEVSVRLGTPLAWAHSSVSTFGERYSPPIQDMSLWHSVEALVEGSDMSMLREGTPMTPDYAWAHREGRNTRYDNKRVGGTVCVHFIKKNMWFLETALTFLGMQDTTELEMHPSGPNDEENEHLPLASSRHQDYPNPVTTDVGASRVDPDTPTLPTKDMRVLLVQSGADGLPVRMEGAGARSGDSIIPLFDEVKWSEGTPGDNRKRGSDPNAPEERDNQATVVPPPVGHFANGSKRVNKR